MSAATSVSIVVANTLTIIAAGVTRTSTAANGIANVATLDNCDVRVDGTVYSQGHGVVLLSNNVTDQHSLVVGLGGVVMANLGSGALLQGTNASVLNYGQIGSEAAAGVLMSGPGAVVENHGAIFSASSIGVSVSGISSVVRNFGSISSTLSAGVSLNGLGSSVENYGTIVGRTTAIDGSVNADRVVNAGTLIGLVFLDLERDEA